MASLTRSGSFRPSLSLHIIRLNQVHLQLRKHYVCVQDNYANREPTVVGILIPHHGEDATSRLLAVQGAQLNQLVGDNHQAQTYLEAPVDQEELGPAKMVHHNEVRSGGAKDKAPLDGDSSSTPVVLNEIARGIDTVRLRPHQRGPRARIPGGSVHLTSFGQRVERFHSACWGG